MDTFFLPQFIDFIFAQKTKPLFGFGSRLDRLFNLFLKETLLGTEGHLVRTGSS